MRWLDAARARLKLLLSPGASESRATEEMAFHIDMEAERLVRSGVPADDARRQALAAFGGVTQHRETLREGRGLAWFSGFSLDIKLGIRMLVKYPGLTVIGGLAMAFAIWAGTVAFEMGELFLHPSLPMQNGDRIVAVQNWDVTRNDDDPRILSDLALWKSQVKSITDLGAFRDFDRNLVIGGNDAGLVRAAEMSAAGFRVVSATPLLGRVLDEGDERPGASPVIVIGYDLWQRRFAGDARAVGQTVRIGDTQATIVGVMREGFEFPMSQEVWLPLPASELEQQPRSGPNATVFGRLAPGASIASAQAEMTVIGRRTAADHPLTHHDLQPRVQLYPEAFYGPHGSDRPIMYVIQLFVLALVALLCSNVALLMFARAATREAELIVRGAIGASRGRLIGQFFAEALVLGVGAAGVGLGMAGLLLNRWGPPFLEANFGQMPFWFHPHLSAKSVVYAAGLTVFAALIAGVMPAMKVTRGLASRLKESGAGAGGLRFGGVWTAVIVAQVAVTVAFPAGVWQMQRELVHVKTSNPGYAAPEFLGVAVDVDVPTGVPEAVWRPRYAASLEALRQRVASEPGVAGVTLVDRLPQTPHTERLIEVDASDAQTRVLRDTAAEKPEVALASIEPAYFDALNTPMIAGRPFDGGDVARDAKTAIVDQSFVELVLGGANAVGRRFRFADGRYADTIPLEKRPWYEIVGVVKDLGMSYPARHHKTAGVYLPMRIGTGPVQMMVHARGAPLALTPKIRAAALSVDPTLKLSEFQRLDRTSDDLLWFIGLWMKIASALTALALMLSLAGIYAVLSFTVSRRTREIGVRVALGANRRELVAAIFRRPLIQVGAGVLAGGVLVAIGAIAASDGRLSIGQIGALIAYAIVMMGVCLLACVVPTRRALGVEPTIALRAE